MKPEQCVGDSVRGRLDCDAITFVHEHSQHEIQGLLRARGDEYFLRGDRDAVRPQPLRYRLA